MASLRRTKNFANDPQTSMFLYTILKQLDLRAINWNEVAESHNISNGHAARMRYSRMRSQFEGLSAQPKTPKPKKQNTGESKSSRDKVKNNKRLLIEEENERLAGKRPTSQLAMQQESDPKRMKVEPQSYMTPWNSTGMYTGYTAQTGANTYWGQPAIKTEPLSFGVQTIPLQGASTIPAIKREPGSAVAPFNHMPTSTLAIKQESDVAVQDSEMSDPDLVVVKREQGTTFADQATPLAAHAANKPSSYPLSHTVSTYFDRQQNPMTATQAHLSSNGMPGYLTSQAFPGSTYGATDAYNTAQSAFSRTTPAPSQHAPPATVVDDPNYMTLNPYATTYEDMLNMPLYRPSSAVLQIPDPRTPGTMSQNEARQEGQEQDVSNKGSPTAASAQEHQVLSGNMTSASIVTPIVSPETSTATSNPTPPKTSGEQALGTTEIIEVESDTEVEVDAVDAPVANHNGETKVKNEVVEL